ncbi:hypothetical protein Q7P35_004731 [Cladosporium inversicolor]
MNIYLNSRKAALNQQEKDSAAGKKTSDDRNAAFTQKEKGFTTNKKAFEDREATLAKREKERSAEWNKKMDGLQKSLAEQNKSVAGGSGFRYKALQATAEAREKSHWAGV